MLILVPAVGLVPAYRGPPAGVAGGRGVAKLDQVCRCAPGRGRLRRPRRRDGGRQAGDQRERADYGGEAGPPEMVGATVVLPYGTGDSTAARPWWAGALRVGRRGPGGPRPAPAVGPHGRRSRVLSGLFARPPAEPESSAPVQVPLSEGFTRPAGSVVALRARACPLRRAGSRAAGRAARSHPARRRGRSGGSSRRPRDLVRRVLLGDHAAGDVVRVAVALAVAELAGARRSARRAGAPGPSRPGPARTSARAASIAAVRPRWTSAPARVDRWPGPG